MKFKKFNLVKYIQFLIIVIIFIFISYLCIKYASVIKSTIKDPRKLVDFKKFINSFGFLSIFIIILAQVIQVIFAIIPSEPIELVAGMSYGGIFGFIVCYIGVTLGSVIVFYVSRKYGAPLVNAFYKQKHINQFKFLENSSKLEIVTFILYFIPGLPKDVFTYVAALTPINFTKFIIISSLSRIPSIIVTTVGGQNFMEGNYRRTAVIFSVFALLGAIGMFTYKKITAILNNKNKRP